MKKKIVSTLVVIGLLIVLGGYSYNVQYRQKPEIKHFTAFFSVTGRPLGTQNDIKEIIADEIGADCEENWLVGQSKEEVLNSYIASGEYPDFILGEKALLEADALIPIDEYWDDYPNLRLSFRRAMGALPAGRRTYLLDSTVLCVSGREY